jgi:hypothetical protein
MSSYNRDIYGNDDGIGDRLDAPTPPFDLVNYLLKSIDQSLDAAHATGVLDIIKRYCDNPDTVADFFEAVQAACDDRKAR